MAPRRRTGVTDRKISGRKATELRHRLEQQYRLFDITLSSISDFAYILDREGRFVYVNQALLDLWGLKLDEAVGKNFYELKYPDELAARLQRQVQQVFDTKEGLIDETPYTSPTGAGGYYEYIFRPVFDAKGSVEVVAGSTRDITERKRVEAELRQSRERLGFLAETLEYQVNERTAELEQRTTDVLAQADQLRRLSVHLMETQDHERRRIARELHDSAGQIMAALLMNLRQMAGEISVVGSPALIKLSEEVRACAEELNNELRTTSYLLHPPLLDEAGLRPAMEWYLDGLKQRAGLEVDLNIPPDFERIDRDVELAMFRIVQECLTNVHRHSGSKTASISVALHQGCVVVEISDAGRGIPSENLAKVQSQGSGVGLRGIRERVRQFEGEVLIDSLPGIGTTVRVSIPLASPDPA